MKATVLGISGSSRHGNTDTLIKESLRAASALGVRSNLLLTSFEIVKQCLTYQGRRAPYPLASELSR